MGWIIISLFFVANTMLIIHYNVGAQFKDWPKHDEYIIGFVISSVLSLMFVAVAGGIYGVIEGRDITAEGCEEHLNSWDIVSVGREKNTTSSFVLGTGGGRTVDTYYVYRQDSEGLLLKTYKTQYTYIVEQDGPPRYERIDYICPQPVYDFFWWSTGNTHYNYGRTGTLYVPKNTILREFRL
jgi:hypothetical protein